MKITLDSDGYATRVEALTVILAGEILLMAADWAEGRNASPDQMDWVRAGDKLLAREYPGYIGSTEEGREFLASELFEDSGEKYVTEVDLAAHIIEVLTAE